MNQVLEGRDFSAVEVENHVIKIHRPVAFEVPRAAALIGALPSNQWLPTLEDILQYGAAALMSVKVSASVQLLEKQMEGLVGELRSSIAESLGTTLESDREQAKETLSRLLSDHALAIDKLLVRYVDPNSKEGLPAIVTERLDQLNRAALRQLDAVFQDGDDSALGKLASRLTRQIADVERNVCNQISARNALLTKSMHKGRPFEEAITAELAELVRPYGGQVERVGDTLGVKRQKHGDHVITFSGPLAGGNSIRIAIEAKTAGAQSFTFAAVRSACQRARENREASACIFIGESNTELPDARAFGPVGKHDYFVAWCPDGPNELLGLTVYLALAGIMHDAAAAGDADLDRAGLRKEIDGIRAMLEELSGIETCHSTAVKSIEKARLALAGVRSNILSSLMRLDSLMSG